MLYNKYRTKLPSSTTNHQKAHLDWLRWFNNAAGCQLESKWPFALCVWNTGTIKTQQHHRISCLTGFWPVTFNSCIFIATNCAADCFWIIKQTAVFTVSDNQNYRQLALLKVKAVVCKALQFIFISQIWSIYHLQWAHLIPSSLSHTLGEKKISRC